MTTELERDAKSDLHLRILHTTDVHAQLCDFDYFADRPETGRSLTRAATLIARARAETGNCLLFDTGDFLQGTPLADVAAAKGGSASAGVHPVIAAMNHLGYDAVTPGNHDFNFGLPFLDRALAQARFEVVCANVFGAAPPRQHWRQPYAMLTRSLRDLQGRPQQMRIGVFGVLPPQIVAWDKMHLLGVIRASAIVDAARHAAGALRARGADLVIGLCHTGLDLQHDGPEGINCSDRDPGGPRRNEQGPEAENAASAVAALDEVDVVLAGHTHLVFPNPGPHAQVDRATPVGHVHGTPVTMAGHSGSHVGQIDLVLKPDAQGWRVARADVAALPVGSDIPEDPGLVASVAAAHAETLSYIRQPVGRLNRPVHSYFSLVQEDDAIRIVAEAQRRFVVDALRDSAFAELPVLSAVAPFKAGGRGGPENYTDVAEGEVTMAAIADMHLFPNDIAALEVTGAQLRDWLEMSAGVFQRVVPGHRKQALRNEAFPSYNFDVIRGVQYRIDVSAPPRFTASGQLGNGNAWRIVDLRFEGRPVRDADRFVVATNSYRAGGGGAFPGISHMPMALYLPRRIRDILAQHVATGVCLFGEDVCSWRFVSHPGTSVAFATGPGALAHVVHATGLPLKVGPATPDGFVEMEMAL